MILADRLAPHGGRTGVVSGGRSWTYSEIDDRSRAAASRLLAGRADLDEARVALLVPPGIDFVALLLGIFRAGGVAVPLALSHPARELAHVIGDAGASVVVTTPELRQRLPGGLTGDVLDVADLGARAATRPALPAVARDRRALIVYTSGTTGRPKGVVTTHDNLAAQVQSLVQAWEWRADDRTLLVLPLHHVHGLINVVSSALWSGAACEMPASFDAAGTWERLASRDITVLTAVPTIYHRLIAAWDAAGAETRRHWSAGCAGVRLMMSGSAALPVSLLERWRAITGHVLLERYGMTEIGMALSNPLHGERRPGTVGAPLPGVEVRIVDERAAAVEPGTPGELEVRGPGVFREYWQQPAATREAFVDGWFRTGDVAVLESGYYRLLGRTSTDILKTGGFKISALEIEETLRDHPAIAECAVVGVDDEEWGQRVCAAVELRAGAALGLEELAAWGRDRLAPYKVPRALVCVSTLPRNAMGKIVKADVAALFLRRQM
jgi:malonyl-CoA/methylmalonyl-CoA synthetase